MYGGDLLEQCDNGTHKSIASDWNKDEHGHGEGMNTGVSNRFDIFGTLLLYLLELREQFPRLKKLWQI